MADLRFEKDGIKIPSINIAPVSRLVNVTQKYDNIGLIRPVSSHVGTFDIIEDDSITSIQSALTKLNTLWEFDDYDAVNHVLTWGNSTISSSGSNSCDFIYDSNTYQSYTNINHNYNRASDTTYFIKTDRCIIMIGTYYCIFIGYATNIETNTQIKCSGHISTMGDYDHSFYLDNGEYITLDAFPSNSSPSDNSDFFQYSSIISTSHYVIDKFISANILGRRDVRGEYLIETTPLYLISRFALVDSVLSSTAMSTYAISETIDKLISPPQEEVIIEELKTDCEEIRPMFFYNLDNFNSTTIRTLTANNCIVVGHNAFYRNYSLEQVNLGANLDSPSIVLNTQAFTNCRRLHTFNIPDDSTLSTGDYVFFNCDNLVNIKLNNLIIAGASSFFNTGITELNTSRLIRANASSFANCKNLTTVNLPNTTYLENYAFSESANLTNVSLPKLTTIQGYAFRGTNITDIDLPLVTNLTSQGIFYNCVNLRNINVPNVSGSLGSSLFYNCSNLISVNLPNITSVGSSVFGNCSTLTEINLPNVTTLTATNAFSNCSNLISVSLPNFTTNKSTIADFIFLNCSNLTTLNVPNNNINRVNASAFYNCSNFSDFDFAKIDAVMSNAFVNTAINSINAPNLTTISDNAFNSCHNLTSINLPKITTLSNDTFRSCSNLITVNLPNLTSVRPNCFRDCVSLNNIVLTNVAVLNTSLFRGCTSLTSYDFTGTKTNSIYNYCFAGSGLTEITVPANISISEGAFSNCSNLNRVTLTNHSSVTANMFRDSTNLTYLKLTRTSVVTHTSTALVGTKIDGGAGLIIVPDNLVSNYRSASGWANLPQVNQIVGFSDVDHVTIVKHPNLLENIEFEQGAISVGNNGGNITTSTASIRTTEYIHLEEGTTYYFYARGESENLNGQIVYYNLEGSNYSYAGYDNLQIYSNMANGVKTIDTDCYAKIVCTRYRTSYNLTPEMLNIAYIGKDYAYPYEIVTDNQEGDTN